MSYTGQPKESVIDSVPQAGRVPCHHGDTQTNKPTKCDDRVDPLIFPLHNADKAQVAPPIGQKFMTTFYFQIYIRNIQNECSSKELIPGEAIVPYNFLHIENW